MSKIGPHIGVKPVLADTIKSVPSSCNCFQCFLGAPIQYNVKNLSDKDISDAQTLLHEKDMTMYVHAPYVINLANPEKSAVGRSSLQKLLLHFFQNELHLHQILVQPYCFFLNK